MTTRRRLEKLLNPNPDWYEDGSFRYDGRFLLGSIPGLVLLASIHGASFFLITIPFVLLVAILHSLGHHRFAAVVAAFTLCLVIGTNTYLMSPRIVLQSIANFPVFVFLHFFILLMAMWGMIHLVQFKRKNPTFSLMVEYCLFMGYPPVFVALLMWKTFMLFGSAVLPLAVCLASSTAVALFVSPVVSSFSKPNTPLDSAVVQFTSISISIILMSLAAPLITLLVTSPAYSILDTVWYTSLPVLLLTVLAGDALQYWMSLPSHAVTFLMISSGFIVWALSSLQYHSSGYFTQQPLAIPLFGAQLSMTALAKGGTDYDQYRPPSLLSPAVIAVCIIYGIAFISLPWSISYRILSFVPLSLVQILMFVLSIGGVLLLIRWRTVPNIAWTCYHGAFILFELLLFNEGSYPLLFILMTAGVGGYLAYRLWQVDILDRVSACTCLCAHMSKLSVLLSAGMGVAHYAPAFTRIVSIFLITIAITNGLLFESKINSTKLLLYCGVLGAGLLLAVDGVITPLWLVISHEHPLTSDIIALLSMIVAIYVLIIAPPITSHDTLPQYVSALLLGAAFTMATLRPSFSPIELSYSVMVVMVQTLQQSDDPPLDEDIVMGAWLNVTKWALLVSLIVVVLVALKRLRRLMYLAMSVSGFDAGLLATVWLWSDSPLTISGTLYALSCCLLTIILTRIYHEIMDTPTAIMFILELALFGITLFYEWVWLKAPGYYATPATRLYLVIFLLIGTVCRCFLMQYPPKRHQISSMFVVNTSILLTYLLFLLNPIHEVYEVSVLFSSILFLFSYNTSQKPLPLVLTLLATMATLFCIAYYTAFMKLWHTTDAEMAAITEFVVEILLLSGILPCSVYFLDTIYSDAYYVSVRRLVLLVLPSLALLYFGTSRASSVLAVTAVVGAVLSYRPVVS